MRRETLLFSFLLVVACLVAHVVLHARQGLGDWAGRMTESDRSCTMIDWRHEREEGPIRRWCLPTATSERGKQQALLEDMFRELEAIKAKSGEDYLTALHLGVRRRVAVVGPHRLLNPAIVSVSGDDQKCKESGISKRRPRTVIVESDDPFERTSLDVSVRRRVEMTGVWSCNAHMATDELRG